MASMTILIVDERRRRQRLGDGPSARPGEGRLTARNSGRGPLAADGKRTADDSRSPGRRPTDSSSPIRRMT